MYGNWENALMDYMSSKTVETLQQIRKELKSIISAGHDEGTLRKIVTRDLGANFYAPGDGTTYQVWLEKVYEMAGDWIKKKVEH
jgi:flagellar capping protein FliD